MEEEDDGEGAGGAGSDLPPPRTAALSAPMVVCYSKEQIMTPWLHFQASTRGQRSTWVDGVQLVPSHYTYCRPITEAFRGLSTEGTIGGTSKCSIWRSRGSGPNGWRRLAFLQLDSRSRRSDTTRGAFFPPGSSAPRLVQFHLSEASRPSKVQRDAACLLPSTTEWTEHCFISGTLVRLGHELDNRRACQR